MNNNFILFRRAVKIHLVIKNVLMLTGRLKNSAKLKDHISNILYYLYVARCSRYILASTRSMMLSC